jgi:2-isopropylmalate synthase
VIAALARCNDADIDRAGWSLAPAPRRRIHVFIATSDLHLERKLRISREQCLDAAVAAVHRARRYTDDVQFSAEDATRSDIDFLCRVVEEVISAGCTTINLPDTVGYSTPDEIARVLPHRHRAGPNAARHVQRPLPRRSRAGGGQHAGGDRRRRPAGGVHDQRHRRAGRQRLARGSRHGHPRPRRPAAVRDRHRHAPDLPGQPAADAVTGEGVQANKAIVGRNAFAHEAGIHQDGMLKDRRTYEIMRPEDVGVPQATLVLGKHSGRHAVQRRCEQLGISLERRDLDAVYRAVIELADARRRSPTPTSWPSSAAARGVPAEAIELTSPACPTFSRRPPKSATATAYNPAFMRASILLAPGDGIGPEVVARRCVCSARCRPVRPRVHLQRDADRRRGAAARPAAAAARDAGRRPEADAILLGAVGDPEFDRGTARAARGGAAGAAPRADLYANLRPARVWPGLEDAGPLKPEVLPAPTCWWCGS